MPGPLRIACIGGESTGKTTLARALAQSTGGVLVAECLREFVREHGRPPRAQEQRALLDAQRSRELALAALVPDGVLVCDPATLMIAIYSELYFADSSLNALALEHAHDYDALLWCRPDIPWVAEPGQHDGPQFRERADELLAGWVARHGARHRVLEVTGDEGRIDRAQALLKRGLGSVWQPGATTEPT